jgi:CHAD domain-containing protein
VSNDLRIDPHAPLADELRRIACTDLDAAIEDLGPVGDPLGPDAVHDVRKRLKRLRALVRLGRGGALDTDLARAENVAYRDLGRLLSAHRDVEALGETIERLHKAAAGGDPHVRHLLVDLESAVEERVSEASDDLAPVDEARKGLSDARDRVEHWEIDDRDGWDQLEPGLLRQYRQGRRAMEAVGQDQPTDAGFHEWRKRVKDHWYQLQFLEAAWPKVLKATAKEAHRLADLLGDDHDLAELSTTFDLEPVVAVVVADERERLQTAALVLGAKVHAEPPKRLGRRLGRYWDSATRRT